MNNELMVARMEHELMRAEVAEMWTRDGVPMADSTSGMLARVKAWFARTSKPVVNQPQSPSPAARASRKRGPARA